MNEYLFFNGTNEGFDDGEGNMVSLGEHLDYLDEWGGTPDCYWSFTGSYVGAKAEALAEGFPVCIVDATTNRVVYKANF